VVIRLCFGGRGRGGRAYARCHAARAKLTAPCTLNMLAAAACGACDFIGFCEIAPRGVFSRPMFSREL
jgi:hypothetical protein